MAVNVLSNQTLKASAVQDTQFLSGLVPGLSITKSNSSQYYLRGVGASSSSVNSEQSVASYIDGVYLYATHVSLSLANLERVEVLRGPQGTLFGRNTTGGVIQGITRDPLAQPALEATLGYGNYRTLTATVYGNAHLTSNLGVALSLDLKNQGDGYGYNSVTNQDAFIRDDTTFRAKVAFEPGPGTSITGFFQYKRTRDTGLNIIPVPGTRGLDGVDGSAYRDREIRAGQPNSYILNAYLGYLKLQQDVGDFAQITSISSYQLVTPRVRFDQDGTPLDIVTASQNLKHENVSQEVQFSSLGSGRFTWLLGTFYYYAADSMQPTSVEGAAAGASKQVRYYRDQRTESIAGFGQLTYKLTDTTKVTAGLRYTDERQKLGGRNETLIGLDPGATILPFAQPPQNSSGWTWRLALDQKLSPDVMAYISWNRGLKSGGITLITVGNQPSYAPEKLDAYEAGMKIEALDKRLRINPSIFLYKFRDMQFIAAFNGTTAVQNAAASTIKGIDIDAAMQFSRRLQAWASFEYLDAKYDRFPNAVFYLPVAAPAGGAIASLNRDATGNTLPYAPRYSGSAGFSYKVPVGDNSGELALDGSLRHVSRQFVGASNLFEIRPYTVATAGLSWTSADQRFGVRIWGDNLFNKEYSVQIFESSTGIFDIKAPPRTYGLTLSAKM